MLHTNRTKPGVLVVTSILLSFIVGSVLLRTQPSIAQDAANVTPVPPTVFPAELAAQPVLGVFEGITPCSSTNPPLPQIPEDTTCEMMIWSLTLHQNPATGKPTTYKLVSAYGLPQQNTRGLQGGGTALNLEGKWTIIQGAKADPDAVVYQLNPDVQEDMVNFIKLDENLLHVLTADKRLMVGNAGWSYTLNRTDKRVVSAPAAASAEATPQTTPLTTIPGETADSAVFEGRIPCVDILRTIFNISTSGCPGVKLRLTLHQHVETRTPTTYELESTQYRAEGTWVIFRGSQTDRDALVYQLNVDGSQPALYLLSADEQHLFFLDSELRLMVGDAQMSYTLSRVD
jgi:hypothetical protein